MTVALGIAFMIMQIMSIVFFFIVLIKLFKNEGALKGILGFIFGIYAFIWGWIKHKELDLTKIMVLWSVFTVASIVLAPVIVASGTMELMKYAAKFSDNPDFQFVKQNSSTGKQKIKLSQKINRKKTASNVKKKNPANQGTKQNTDWGQKAMALWQNGKYKNPNKAIEYWGHAIKQKQNIPRAYNNRGLAYYDLKQYQKAIKDYDQAIKQDPDYVAALNNRGNSYYELAEYQQALTNFSQSLQLEPNYAKAHFNRGLVYYQLNQSDQACNDFQKACEQGDCDGIKWANKNEVCQETELMGLR
jgi:tetratricopeptide (TPR) repeat protein